MAYNFRKEQKELYVPRKESQPNQCTNDEVSCCAGTWGS